MGRITLNENPENYFAQIEQAAFSPAHMPPGIEASPDKMLQVNTLNRIPPSSRYSHHRVDYFPMRILIFIVLERIIISFP